jgi:DNA excision repair protein ERCC-8
VGEAIGGRAPLTTSGGGGGGRVSSTATAATIGMPSAGVAPHDALAIAEGLGISGAARAHEGLVSCVMPSPDGLFWMTAGADNRLRLWDSSSWRRAVRGFRDTHNAAIRLRQMAVSEDGRVVFYPLGSYVKVRALGGSSSLLWTFCGTLQ